MSPLKGHFVAAPHDTGDPVTGHYYETASNDPGCAQVWGYTSHMTCKAGDRLALHVNASAPRVRVTILRDALVPEVVLETEIDRDLGLITRGPAPYLTVGAAMGRRFKVLPQIGLYLDGRYLAASRLALHVGVGAQYIFGVIDVNDSPGFWN